MRAQSACVGRSARILGVLGPTFAHGSLDVVLVTLRRPRRR